MAGIWPEPSCRPGIRGGIPHMDTAIRRTTMAAAQVTISRREPQESATMVVGWDAARRTRGRACWRWRTGARVAARRFRSWSWSAQDVDSHGSLVGFPGAVAVRIRNRSLPSVEFGGTRTDEGTISRGGSALDFLSRADGDWPEWNPHRAALFGVQSGRVAQIRGRACETAMICG